MINELNRVESAVTATASGDLSWERWPLEAIIALGLSGQKNPLGFAVVRYLTNPPSAMNTWNVLLVLATEMQRRGMAADGIKEHALRALELWNNDRCPTCHGRGVLNIEQQMCGSCGGTGKIKIPEHDVAISTGVACLVEAEVWMERQLTARLSKG
ncbi:MAG: hypothetical protein H6R14_784 [Proteobacteria bacterium]|nr:hypothetical protein [Pseudomonadota bacterium]